MDEQTAWELLVEAHGKDIREELETYFEAQDQKRREADRDRDRLREAFELVERFSMDRLQRRKD